jgi:hypothetical protein
MLFLGHVRSNSNCRARASWTLMVHRTNSTCPLIYSHHVCCKASISAALRLCMLGFTAEVRASTGGTLFASGGGTGQDEDSTGPNRRDARVRPPVGRYRRRPRHHCRSQPGAQGVAIVAGRHWPPIVKMGGLFFARSPLRLAAPRTDSSHRAIWRTTAHQNTASHDICRPCSAAYTSIRSHHAPRLDDHRERSRPKRIVRGHVRGIPLHATDSLAQRST